MSSSGVIISKFYFRGETHYVRILLLLKLIGTEVNLKIDVSIELEMKSCSDRAFNGKTICIEGKTLS